MTVAERIANFFNSVEEIWEAIPSPVKVFLYSTASSVVGLWAADSLGGKAVALIVLANLGLYQAPRTVGTQVKKLMK